MRGAIVVRLAVPSVTAPFAKLPVMSRSTVPLSAEPPEPWETSFTSQAEVPATTHWDALDSRSPHPAPMADTMYAPSSSGQGALPLELEALLEPDEQVLPVRVRVATQLCELPAPPQSTVSCDADAFHIPVQPVRLTVPSVTAPFAKLPLMSRSTVPLSTEPPEPWETSST